MKFEFNCPSGFRGEDLPIYLFILHHPLAGITSRCLKMLTNGWTDAGVTGILLAHS